MNGKLLILFVIILVALGLATFLGGNLIENMENATDVSGSTIETSSTTTPVATPNDIPSIPVPPPGPSPVPVESAQSQSIFSSLFPASFTTPSITIPSFTITPTPMNPIPPTQNTSVGTQSNIKSTSDFDNYNHYNKTSYPDLFYGTNGGTARIIDTGSNNMLIITQQNGTTDMYYLTGEKGTSNAYFGPNGSTAKVETDQTGVSGIKVSRPDGSLVYFTRDSSVTQQKIDETLKQTDVTTGASKGATLKEAFSLPLQDEQSKWQAALPKGIPKSQILPGEEDLYILKSEVIPPVCPKCPDPIVNCPGNDKFDAAKCPPCPPCARCPEPAFECKKVPNYNAFNQNYMPVPVLNDFSSFGM
jgi:hypothetical protein